MRQMPCPDNYVGDHAVHALGFSACVFFGSSVKSIGTAEGFLPDTVSAVSFQDNSSNSFAVFPFLQSLIMFERLSSVLPYLHSPPERCHIACRAKCHLYARMSIFLFIAHISLLNSPELYIQVSSSVLVDLELGRSKAEI